MCGLGGAVAARSGVAQHLLDWCVSPKETPLCGCNRRQLCLSRQLCLCRLQNMLTAVMYPHERTGYKDPKEPCNRTDKRNGGDFRRFERCGRLLVSRSSCHAAADWPNPHMAD